MSQTKDKDQVSTGWKFLFSTKLTNIFLNVESATSSFFSIQKCIINEKKNQNVVTNLVCELVFHKETK